MRLLRKILWCINYGDKRKSYETLCQQSYEIAALDCNSDEAVERLERWKRAVAGLLRDNKELAERFGRLLLCQPQESLRMLIRLLSGMMKIGIRPEASCLNLL